MIWVMAEFGCVSGMFDVGGAPSPTVLLTIASVPFLAVAAGAVYVGRRRQRSLAGDDARSSERFMARAGVITSGIFLGIMLAEMIPIFYFLDECRSFTMLLDV